MALAGKLMPNCIPYHWWQIISVDLIMELPQSHGYKSILVAVDQLSKQPTSFPPRPMLPHSGSPGCFKTVSGSSDGKAWFSSVQYLNLRMPNRTIRSVWQFSGTLNGTWRSGSKSVQFTFERSSNANVSWDPPAGRRECMHQCGTAAGSGGTRW